MRKLWTVVAVVFCVLLLFTSKVCASTASEELTQRTLDNINSFLRSTDFALLQILETFELGFISSNPTSNSTTEYFDLCRRLMSTQMLAQDEIASIFIYVNGQFVGTTRENNLFLSSQALLGATCDNAVSNDTICIHNYLTDDIGNPTHYAGSTTSKRAFSGLSNNGSTTWTPVLKISANILGIAKSSPVRDPNGNIVGFVAVAISLPKLSEFLISAFGEESDSRVVYIAEHESNNLIAASAGDFVVTDANNQPQQLNAANSSSLLIRESIAGLHTKKFDAEDFVSFITNGFFVEATDLSAVGFDWHVVVVRVVDITQDIISTSSTAFYVLAVMASLSIFLSILLGLWVIRFWNLQLWKAAQPPLVLFILAANILSASCTFVLSGLPSKSLCLARQWMVVLAVTLTCSAFLAKLLRVYLTTRTKHVLKRGRLNHITSTHVVVLMAILILVQVSLLVIWTALDPMEPHFSYSVTDGVASGVEQCKSDSSWGVSVCATFVALLIAGGCYLSYVNRDVSEMLAESRAVMMTFYHGAFIGAVLLFVGLFANVSTKSFLLFMILAMIWFSTTTQVALFLPRVYRQVTLGDLTQWEVKEMVVHHLNKQYITENPTAHARATFSQPTPLPTYFHNKSNAHGSRGTTQTAVKPDEDLYVI